MPNRPFADGDVYVFLRMLTQKVTEEINSLDNEYVLKVSPTELENHYVHEVIVEPLILNIDQRYIEDRTGTKILVADDPRRGLLADERPVLVQGTKVEIAIPFEGDLRLWRFRPSTYSTSGYPDIVVRTDSIILVFSFRDDSADSESLKRDIDSDIERLADAIRNLERDVQDHNQSAPPMVRKALERKRQLAEATVGTIADLGIPVRRRDQPLTYIIPTHRRKLPTQRPKVSTESFEPEPVLEDTEYQHILQVMRSMSLVIERNPNAFSLLTEEGIRTHFLLQLNGHYEGNATGETFNASGKTDILVRVGDRNVFIAECKFWRGPRAFNEAIDQLLNYLSWRDSKCALLIFNRNKDSSAVRQKMHEQMEARPEHRRTILHKSSGDSRYLLIKESDPGREIIVTTQIYDFPVALEAGHVIR